MRLVFAFMLLSFFSFGQVDTTISYKYQFNSNTESSFFSIQKQSLEIKYPVEARKNLIQGNVKISFDIDSTCNFQNIKIIQSLGYGCDETAVEALKKVEKTLQSKANNNCHKVKGLIIPIQFSLN